MLLRVYCKKDTLLIFETVFQSVLHTSSGSIKDYGSRNDTFGNEFACALLAQLCGHRATFDNETQIASLRDKRSYELKVGS